MKKTNFTFLKTRVKQTTMLFSFLFTMLCSVNMLQAQCSLACNGTTQVSLDANCSAIITESMILNSQSTTCMNIDADDGDADLFDNMSAGVVDNGDFIVTYTVEVLDASGNVTATSPMVSTADIGQTRTVRVTASIQYDSDPTAGITVTSSTNACWGNLVVEDKISPVFDATSAQADLDISYYCLEEETFNDRLRGYVQECSDFTIAITSETTVTNNCSSSLSNEILKTISRSYVITDASGNTSTAMLTFDVNRIPSQFPNDIDPHIAASNTTGATFTSPANSSNPITAGTSTVAFPNLIFPSSLLSSDNTALSCSGTYVRDASNNPAPVGTTTNPGTGVPLLDKDGYLQDAFYTNAIVTSIGATALNDWIVLNPAYGTDTGSPIGPATDTNPATPTGFPDDRNDEDDLGNPKYLLASATILAERPNPAFVDNGNNMIGDNIDDDNTMKLDTDGVTMIPITMTDPGFVDMVTNYTSNGGSSTTIDNLNDSDGAFVDDIINATGAAGSDNLNDTALTPRYLNDNSDRISLYPTPYNTCNLVASYTDVTLPKIGCVTKIMRTWLIVEWSCDSRVITVPTQMIETVDNEAPTFDVPDAITVTTNVNGSFTSTTHGAVTCGANVTLAALTNLTDNCDTDANIELDISYGSGQFLDNVANGGNAIQLPFGPNTVTYTVYDGCGNSRQATQSVTVEDRTSPVAICVQNTVVSLTNNEGPTLIPATTFDAGSYDDCQLAGVSVSRMDDTTETFGSTVSFTCDDIGTPVTVIFRATDSGALTNDCMVTVEVQDKIAPSIICPLPMTVNCDFAYDLNNLSASFGIATATDNCGVTIDTSYVLDLDQCRQGTLTRTFTATDNGGRSTTCQQVITFEKTNMFGCTRKADGTPQDITWPGDPALITECFSPTDTRFLPATTGFPSFNEGACDLVGASYIDQVYPFNNSTGDEACFKIIREWTVIDWCQYSTTHCGDNSPTASSSYPTWMHTQVIRVSDNDAPVITSDCTPTSAMTFDNTCSSGVIELGAIANDACTDQLTWSYIVDLNNDGVADTNDASNSISNTGLSDTIAFSNSYPVGSHKITYTFADRCGNTVSCEQEFTIINAKTPSVYCIDGLSTDLMPTGNTDASAGMIDIWASDFDNKSSHPCGYRLVFAFSNDTLDKSRTFNCDSLGIRSVDVYAIAFNDKNEQISFAYCTSNITIQDNMASCANNTGGGAGGVITGRVATEENETLEDVSIQLEGADFNPVNTNSSGEYAFPSMGLGGDYTVQPSKDENPLNGVSTLDLVIIQRHILGIDNLDSPYKYIAADINHDDNISAIDLIELRKMILGVVENFNANESWRFIDSAYSFGDGSDPLDSNIPEAYEIAGLDGDMNIDFTAVKIGDVNNNASTNFNGEGAIENRFVESFEFNIPNSSYSAGEMVEVPFTSAQNADLLGYQFTVDFDADKLEFLEGRSGEILTESYNYGTQLAEQGLVTTSWNTVTPELINEGSTAFTLVFRAKQDGILENDLEVNSQVTDAEAYNTDQELMDINVNFGSEGEAGELGYVLYQNTPNPFDNSTEISFHLPKSMNAQLRIYDVSGRTISVYSDLYQEGMNKIVVDRSTLATVGILYYTLETGDFTATKRMVVIK